MSLTRVTLLLCPSLATIPREYSRITNSNTNENSNALAELLGSHDTISLGVMIMVHGDDLGLALPPRIAPIQVVVLYIEKSSMKADEIEAMRNKAKEIEETLKKAGIRAKLDDRSNYTGGFKMSFWELKGVPMILTLGGREMQSKQVECSLRVDSGDKSKRKNKAKLSWDELTVKVPEILRTFRLKC